jgi:hypothetical protein
VKSKWFYQIICFSNRADVPAGKENLEVLCRDANQKMLVVSFLH